MNKFDEHIQNLVSLCSRIGKIQLENQSSLKIKTKSDKSPVTNIDLLSNDIIVDYLLSNFLNSANFRSIWEFTILNLF